MNQNNSKLKTIGIVFGIIIFIFAILSEFDEMFVLFIPFIMFFLVAVILIFITYTQSKKKKNANREFDIDKSYYRRKDVDEGLLESKRLEENYLKERNYNISNENDLYYNRKITEFDKAHKHENMYPDKNKNKVIKKTVVLNKKIDLEEELNLKKQELKELKKSYNDFQIGLIEYNEKQSELKKQIKEIILELEKGEQN